MGLNPRKNSLEHAVNCALEYAYAQQIDVGDLFNAHYQKSISKNLDPTDCGVWVLIFDKKNRPADIDSDIDSWPLKANRYLFRCFDSGSIFYEEV